MKDNLFVAFYLNDKLLAKYDLLNEFYGEREDTIELLAYENKVACSDIIVKIEGE